MKNKLSIIFILLTFGLFSQSPQYINYQAVARDGTGNIVTSAIGIKFEIFQGSVGGTLVYDEIHTATPSSAGIFTVNIGAGTAGTGNFSTIGWGSGPYFLQVSIDPNGGTSFTTIGASKLVSVPYALFAEKAGNVINYNAGNGISISSGSIINTAPNQTVNISGTGVTGSYPNYSITTSSTSYSAGNGISITSGSVINTAPDQTVNISQTGIAGVTNAYPNFTVNVPAPVLTYNNGTKELTLTQGSASSTATLTGTGSSTVAMYGAGIASVTPSGPGNNFTVNVTNPNFVSAGSTTVNGAWPTYTISSSSVTYSAGAGIAVGSGTITNTAPDKTVTINSAGSITVTGTYPNFTVAAPLPTVTPAPVLTGVGITTVTNVANNYTINTPPVGMSYNNGTGVLSYSPAPGSTTLNLNPAVTFINPVLSVGASTVNIPGTGLWSKSGPVTFLTNTSDWVGLGINSPTTKLQIFGSNTSNLLNSFSSSPETSFRLHNDDLTNNNFSSLIFSTRSSSASNYESAKIVGQNVNHTAGSIAGDLVFFTREPANLLERMRITSTGNIGIGTPNPSQKLDVVGKIRMSDGTEAAGKVLTSDATGVSKWEYALSPSKIGSVGALLTVANSAAYTYYTSSTLLTITPAVSGIVILHFNSRYNFDISQQSQIQVGLHINTTGVAPGTASPFSVASNVGWSSPPTGGGPGDLPVSFFHTMNVIGGTTYYIWFGGYDLNYNQAATLSSTKIVATLHSNIGL